MEESLVVSLTFKQILYSVGGFIGFLFVVLWGAVKLIVKLFMTQISGQFDKIDSHVSKLDVDVEALKLGVSDLEKKLTRMTMLNAVIADRMGLSTITSTDNTNRDGQ